MNFRVGVGAGIAGREKHDDADDHQDHRQDQKGQVRQAPLVELRRLELGMFALRSHRSSLPVMDQYRGAMPIQASTHMTQVMPVKTKKIFSSLQPPISKWWWMGVMRKMRLPWVSLK